MEKQRVSNFIGRFASYFHDAGEESLRTLDSDEPLD